MGESFKWLWLVNLVLAFIKRLIEHLAESNGGQPDATTLLRAAAHVLDPDRPETELT